MPDLKPFDRQELEILLSLVRVRRTYVVEHTQAPEPVRAQLLGLENKITAQLAVADRSMEPDDCDIAAVGGARRCSSCGRYGGGHEVDCLRVQRLEREKLQALCDHRSETKTRTIGDPPGPWCCGRCGLELPVEDEGARSR